MEKREREREGGERGGEREREGERGGEREGEREWTLMTGVLYALPWPKIDVFHEKVSHDSF